MFKSIGTTLITGIITVLPIVLTLYLLYWLAVSSEQVMGALLQWALPKVVYFPGLGTIAGLILVFLVGSADEGGAGSPAVHFRRRIVVPLADHQVGLPRDPRSVRLLFAKERTLRSSRDRQRQRHGNDRLHHPGRPRATAGVLAQSRQRAGLPADELHDRRFTLLIPKDDIKPCQMNMDEAMRFVLTAGITGQKRRSKETARILMKAMVLEKTGQALRLVQRPTRYPARPGTGRRFPPAAYAAPICTWSTVI